MSIKKSLVVLLLAASLMLSACGGSTPAPETTAAAETMPEIILFIFIFHLHPHKKSVYIVNGIFSAHNSQKKEICFFPAVFPETDGKLPCSC